MGMEINDGKKTPPAQSQHKQPGVESKMVPEPAVIRNNYRGSSKLENKTALITGGDSGIGRAVSVHFAREGADVAVIYLDEHEDAEETKRLVELEGQKCHLISGDIGNQSFCEAAVTETINKFKKIDILVNNAAEQHPQDSFMDITSEQLEQTFRTNVFSMFYITKAVLPNLKEGSSIINSSSITAYQGSKDLIDYSATKGAIVSFTRSLSESLAEKGIRVNGVAPGMTWTPLIPASFSREKVDGFGGNAPMKRPGQPQDLAPAYVYLASDDASYVSGQTIHVNGGIIVAG
ncbi:SDR family oxidoreductase [Virgibacillus sp. YIM 98842]|uniref:SDR family oxidoreductase n=1 Tax=Virgibacillus sp. YIM 98842 TaxID=2663533 RepID=UPI0013DBA3DD|nr:SDR family oxidoreductase [Virgibacillus sp. YIM 98842]